MDMEKVQFNIVINAPVEQVFNTMFGKETYRQWTSVFNASSDYEGSWAQDEKILFVGTNKEGKKEGMVGIVKQFIPNNFVAVEYTGFLDGDKQITEGPDMGEWCLMYENYSFTSVGDETTVMVALNVGEAVLNYLKDTYPKALYKLKEICEAIAV
jgi:hypothetical protein